MNQLTSDFENANIPHEEEMLLKYVAKLTREPWSIKEEDISELKNAGFSDEGIFDINQVVSYFNYVNRIADGLGVVLEPGYLERNK